MSSCVIEEVFKIFPHDFVCFNNATWPQFSAFFYKILLLNSVCKLYASIEFNVVVVEGFCLQTLRRGLSYF